MLAVWGPFILVTSQVIPLLQNVLQGHLQLPGEDGVLVIHLKSRESRWAAAPVPLGMRAASWPAGHTGYTAGQSRHSFWISERNMIYFLIFIFF